MAIAPARPLTRVRLRRPSPAALHAARTPAALCALGLSAVVAYAAFASGAIALPNEARLQVAVAVLALFTLGCVLFAPRMRMSAPVAAWTGLGLLALFAVWNGITMAWSIAPDGTWAELNRAISYTLIAAVALAVGSSLPRALERAALGYLVIATAVALYALGGKAFPEVHIGGLAGG